MTARPAMLVIDEAAQRLEASAPALAAELRSIQIGRPKDDGHLERLLSVRARMIERIEAGEDEAAVIRSVAARMGGGETKWCNVLHCRRADVRRAVKNNFGTKLLSHETRP